MRVMVVFKAVTKNWLRSRSGLFFSFLFPVMFLLVFGSIFGNSNNSVPLTVQNNDQSGGVPTGLSQSFVTALNSTKVLSIKLLPVSENVTAYVQKQASSYGGDPRVLVIPAGFAANVSGRPPSAVKLTYISSPSDTLGPQVGGIITSVSNAFNFKIANAQQVISVASVSSSSRVLKYIDYYMPGLIAAFMMTNGVIGLTSIATEFKRSGLTKRLSATPLTKLEWIVGNVMSQAVLALLLAAVMILLGIGIYKTTVTINVTTIAILVMGAVLFSGIGMTLAGLVRDPEAASGLGNALAFPMMFLSGTFWPVSIMPSFLQAAARALPLTYFSDGLRNSMVVGNSSAALSNLGVTAVLAVVFILVGARATRWKEG